MNRMILAALIVAAGSVSASARDSGSPANWSGFYFGGTIGGSLNNSNSFDEDEYFQYGNVNNSGAGVVGGVTMGYNYQFGNGLIGIEADGNWSNFQKTTYNKPFSTSFSNLDAYFSSQWDWFTTVRGRAGLALGNALIYGTGGVALVGLNNKLVVGGSGNCGTVIYTTEYVGAACANTSVTGFVAGVGAEFMITQNWSAKAEYLYISLPNVTANFYSTYYEKTYSTAFKDDAQILRLGVNYHLN